MLDSGTSWTLFDFARAAETVQTKASVSRSIQRNDATSFRVEELPGLLRLDDLRRPFRVDLEHNKLQAL